MGASAIPRQPHVPRRADRPLQPRASSRPWKTLVLAAALLAVLLVAAVLLALQTWTGSHVSPLARAVLRLDLVAGLLPVAVYAVAAIAWVAVIAREPSRGRVLSTAIGAVVGGLFGGGLAWYLSSSDAFGVALDLTTTTWAVAIFAAVGLALPTFWRSPAWRKLLAVVAIVSFAAAGYIGINADFGLDRTVADVAGVSTENTLSVPVVTPSPTPSATPTLRAGGALWANWHALTFINFLDMHSPLLHPQLQQNEYFLF